METGSMKRPLILGALAVGVIGLAAVFVISSSDDETSSEGTVARLSDAEGSRGSDDSRGGEASPLIDLPSTSSDEPVPPGTVVPPQEPPPGAENIGVDAGPRSESAGPEPRRPVYIAQPNIRPSNELRYEREYPQPPTEPLRLRPRDPEEDARNNARIEQVFGTRLEQLREQAGEARRTGDLRRAADLDELVQRMETSQAAFERRRSGH